MRILFLLLLLATGTLCRAQSSEFIRLEQKMQEFERKGLWDEMLLAAPDLLIEEPTRGEGYYYTALAFYRLEQMDKASQYLGKADNLADANLKKKITTLRQDIASGKQALAIEASATSQEQSGNKARAAEEWKKLWEMDKSRIDYALNAVEIYIGRRDFVPALQILDDPEVAKDLEARKLSEMLNETPEMKKINGYNNAMKNGRSQFDKENFTTAISRFDEALSFRPNDTEALKAKRKAEDELAWQNANKENSITGYESYVNGSTLKVHREEAVSIIKKALIYWGDKYATDGDIQQMEYYLNKYFNEYPGGEDKKKAQEIMCAAYYRDAKKSALVKTAWSQGHAVDYFNKVKQICPSGYTLDKDIKTAKRLQLRYGRPNRTYLAYVYDSLMPIGISFGSINNKKLGLYITASMNAYYFTDDAYFTVDNSGTLEGNVYSDIRYNHVNRYGYANFMLGFTKKITYPLWIYAGGGISLNRVWWEMDTYSDNGSFYETNWVKNTDEAVNKPLADAGLIFDLSGLHLRGGVRTTDFRHVRYNVGIGFSWK